MRLEFFLPMVPPTVTDQAKSRRVVKGRAVVYDDAELKAAKAKLEAHLAGHAPTRALIGPVRLMHVWYWPCAGTKHQGGDPRDTKPDTHNLAKAFVDCMERVGFFESGDQQVCDETIRKYWTDTTPGIYVMVEELA